MALKRHMGLWALTLYGVGDILGAGVYGLVGKAAGQMGSAVWLAFLVSMCAAATTGLTYAALGSRFPKAAGASYVLQHVFKIPFLSYTVGLAALASGLTSMATASRVFAGYWHGLFPQVPITLTVVIFVSAMALLVFWGLREAIWANVLCTLVEVSGLLFVIAIGISYWGKADLLNMSTLTNPSGDFSAAILLSGAVLTFYSFIGFEDILNVSEEVKNPERTVPRGILLAVGISSLIYMLVSVTAVSVLPAAELSQSSQPLVDVVRAAAPWFPSHAFSFIAMFAVANTALLNFIMGSRLIYGLAHLGLLPKWLGEVHKTRETPWRAVLLTYLILLVLALSGDVSALARASAVLLLIVFIAMNLSYIKLKVVDHATFNRALFHVPAWVAGLGVLICGLMLSQTKIQEWWIAGSILAVIFALYAILKPKMR